MVSPPVLSAVRDLKGMGLAWAGIPHMCGVHNVLSTIAREVASAHPSCDDMGPCVSCRCFLPCSVN